MLKRDGDINKSSVNSDGWNYNMDECPLDTCVHLLSDNKDILLPQMDFVGTITMDINKGYKQEECVIGEIQIAFIDQRLLHGNRFREMRKL